MDNSELLRKILGNISGKDPTSDQLDLLGKLYSLEISDVKINIEPNYPHRQRHANCSLFVTLGNDWEFSSIDGFRYWLNPHLPKVMVDVFGEYKESDGFTTYYLERSGLCAAFVNNAPRF